MNSTNDKEPCIDCGALINKNTRVTIKTIVKLNNFEPDEYAEVISEREGITSEQAQEYVDHKMSNNCKKSKPPCPSCTSPLKTWHSTECSNCGWVRDPEKILTEYY